jgi:hypothetical protein
MALLSEERLAEHEVQRAGFRLKTAGTKLNIAEMGALEQHCREISKTPGELIRQLILDELARGATTEDERTNRALAEILGVRLLLVNVLRPLAAGQKLSPEAFDKLLDEIGSAKHELAGKLAVEGRK